MGRAAGVNNRVFVSSLPKASSILMEYLFELAEQNKAICSTEFESWLSFFPSSIQEQLPSSALLLAEFNERVRQAVNKCYIGERKNVFGERGYKAYAEYPSGVLRGLQTVINQECAKLLV